MESILKSIKLLLNIMPDCEDFDEQLVMHINTALSDLRQLGVGPSEGFFITDEADTWDDFIQDFARFHSVKTCVYKKVKLAFDPPPSAAALESLKAQIAEEEWRLNVAAESTNSV
jgi:hypothetical protein